MLAVGLFAAWRYAHRSAALLGWIFAAGVILRLTAGLVLYLVSSQNIAALAHLHSGDGFWQLAPDARSYYLEAALAVAKGLDTIPPEFGSHGHVRLLAIWMQLFGVHPLAALMLNIAAYAILMLFAARVARLGLPGRSLALPPALAFSFAPFFLIHATQPLKESVFAALVVTFGVAATRALLVDAREGRTAWGGAPLALAAAAAALYGVAGIRWYFALIAWCGLAVCCVLFAFTQPRRRLPAYALLATVGLPLLWVAADRGSGPGYENPLAREVARWSPDIAHWMDRDVAPTADSAPSGAPVDALRTTRRGFETAGGGTNVTVAAGSTRWLLGADTVVMGLALQFVPPSVLRWTGAVDFAGGRGLLPVADLDTVFLYVILCLLFVRMKRHGSALRFHRAAVAYGVLLSVTTIALLAYVVTNYGTLVRLRMMALFPLLGVPLVLAWRSGASGEVAGAAGVRRSRERVTDRASPLAHGE